MVKWKEHLQWPSQPPDMNPIKNLWPELKKGVHKHKLNSAWRNHPKSLNTFSNRITNYRKRLMGVIFARDICKYLSNGANRWFHWIINKAHYFTQLLFIYLHPLIWGRVAELAVPAGFLKLPFSQPHQLALTGGSQSVPRPVWRYSPSTCSLVYPWPPPAGRAWNTSRGMQPGGILTRCLNHLN